ncbi:hypothetical protein SELMODRAFT_446707 [Selaginella moellendorffii]|uniref:Uncharacterized protein n=1 Tax=Selaginella moellendorffii TaxID=88036 RepID=D8STP4_SELML|nr:hypothetical protein SELMODRAFT_446707 [Selaginella moellendorffii]
MRDDGGGSPSPRQPRSGSRLHMMLSGGSPQLRQQQQQQQQQPQMVRGRQQQQHQHQRKAPEPLRRAVADCLSASHHASLPPLTSEPVRTLQDYLANPSTIHFAYIVLLEHALAERDRSPPVVIKCVALLKRYLFRYVPPITTLQQIDSFCASLINECNAASGKRAATRATSCSPGPSPLPPPSTPSVFASEPLLKSLTYVRAVVARHLPGFSLRQHSASSPSLKLQPVPPSPRSRLLTAHFQPPLTDDKEFARPMLALATIHDDNGVYMAADVLKWRWILPKGSQLWMPSPVMTDSGGIARPNVDNVDNLEQGIGVLWLKRTTTTAGSTEESRLDQLLRASTAAAIGDSAAVKSHLRDVAASKRQPVTRWGGEPSTTMRKRPRPLFQYRCYSVFLVTCPADSKQQPLRLSDADIEEVIAAVCAEASSPTLALAPSLPSSRSGDTANVAGSVLIKLIIDMYLADARTAAPLTLSVLQVMLSSGPVTVRVRAFDLVFNLGVHAHLLEPVQSDDQDGFPTGTTEDVKHGRPRGVEEFEAWLLIILCEMMLFLLQLEEKEESIWAASMSALLYLVCDRGRIRRERLENLDIRILRTLLEISRDNAWAEEIHCRLICMLCNMLYGAKPTDSSQDGNAVFDINRLEAIGGVELICKEYSLVSSPAAKRNLFAIIFEYLLCELRSKADVSGKKFPSQDEVQAIATALVLAGAPDSLSIAFRQRLNGVGGRLCKSIVKALDRDLANGRLNAMVLEQVAKSIDTLVDKYGTLDGEFGEMVSLILADESREDGPPVSYLEARAWAILHALLHSSRSDYRHHGYSWLNQLLVTEVECLHGRKDASHSNCMLTILEQAKVDPPESKTSAAHLLFGLLKSRRHYVRQGFLIVLEHFLSQCQRRGRADDTESFPDSLPSTLVWLMSSSLWQFITANDTNRINVLQMCNLLLSQICVRSGPSAGKHDDDDKKEHNESVRDTVVVSSIASLFLRDEAAAPEHLLTKMPTALFYWPLMQLAGATVDDMTLAIAVGSKGGGNVPGCASDVRAALLLLLVGKCTVEQAALDEVGGEEFFRSLLDDRDARVAYFTASFLIKRMMVEDADNYQRVLHNLVFKAQQNNDEKLLENPYLQLGGILQLDPDIKPQASTHDDS